MGKEYLEALEKIISYFDNPQYELGSGYSCKNELLENYENEVNTIKQALQRLEGIDNANATEALGKLGILASELGTSIDIKFSDTRFPKMLLAIAQALTKDQELEKQLGCPVDVRCKVVFNSIIYNENGEEYSDNLIYDGNFVGHCLRPNSYGFLALKQFKWNDYKKTWWLKKDRSE